MLFATAIGRCAIAWSGEQIVGTALPEADDEAMRARMTRRFPGAVEAAPPAHVMAAIGAVQALLDGERPDLSGLALDLSSVSPFEAQVYAALRTIPAGATKTYGELAAAIGQPHAARAVGVALGRNPFPVLIPCHRILAAGGKSGGFSAPGGTRTKFRILAIEQAGGSGLFAQLPLAVKP